MQIGRVNSKFLIEHQGIISSGTIHYNLQEPALVATALRRGEGILGKGGSFLVTTGKYTGRSPNDKYVVCPSKDVESIWWQNNERMSSENFDLLHADMIEHMQDQDLFVQDLVAGADPKLRVSVRAITELAWHSLFVRHLLRRLEPPELDDYTADCILINCPSFRANPARHGCRSETVIALDLGRKMILIAGTRYAGENKKSVFTLLNFLLPEKNIMPMHCSANHEVGNPANTAIFFGLSGTGKTTLSSDPKRVLIGDDEHAWSDQGISNFEGGCYAKTLSLSNAAEPEIFATTQMFGTIIENMQHDPETFDLDFDDDSITANMRCAYPLDYIASASSSGIGGHPSNIIMLTCDAFGVLPPIARLTPAAAIYHFLSGFTSKVAGTERGVIEPQPTFSTCFGAPFMPRRPEIYGDLLRERIAKHKAECWLVNTGWTGGPYGTGKRMPISATRALLSATLSGIVSKTKFRPDQHFGFAVPVSVPGVSETLLDPRRTWANGRAYDQQARKLVEMFEENFRQFLPNVAPDVKATALKGVD